MLNQPADGFGAVEVLIGEGRVLHAGDQHRRQAIVRIKFDRLLISNTHSPCLFRIVLCSLAGQSTCAAHTRPFRSGHRVFYGDN